MKVAKINLLIAIWGIGFASLAAFEVVPEQTSSNNKRKTGFNPGFIPMWPAYSAKVFEVEKDRHIRYTSPVQRGVHLVVDLTLNHKGGVTHVDEYIEVTTNPIIAKVFLGILKKAHLEVFERLAAPPHPDSYRDRPRRRGA